MRALDTAFNQYSKIPPLHEMTHLLGCYEVLTGRPGYNRQVLSLHNLLYLTSDFVDPPAVDGYTY
ncbi:hypothetical protein [Spartinivicinus ruber]|uniref:hypothetical protein n=1 Tax=Spartinivicinus ruber TaxID=2683272 RepID=UPI0013D08DE0|nr:hypothetical protein [Spartinivicinus ruber]